MSKLLYRCSWQHLMVGKTTSMHDVRRVVAVNLALSGSHCTKIGRLQLLALELKRLDGTTNCHMTFMHVNASLGVERASLTNSAYQISAQLSNIRNPPEILEGSTVLCQHSHFESRCNRWTTLWPMPSLGSLPIGCHERDVTRFHRLHPPISRRLQCHKASINLSINLRLTIHWVGQASRHTIMAVS